MLGIYSFVSFFEKVNLYTFATSFNSFETDFIPDETLVHMIGTTNREVIKTGRELRLIKIIAMNIKDATGVALTALISGVTSTFKKENLVVIAAKIMPIAIANIIPKRMRKRDCEMISQKSAVFISSNMLLIILWGEGIRNVLLTLYAANAHTPSQKRIEKDICENFLMYIILHNRKRHRV